MLDTTTVRALAARLHDAERSRQQIRQISLEHPDITIADAYAIQRAWMDIKLGEGRVKRGHKIGLTSRAMQLSSQIDEPESVDALMDIARNDDDQELRENAIFWLGQSDDPRVADFLLELIRR